MWKLFTYGDKIPGNYSAFAESKKAECCAADNKLQVQWLGLLEASSVSVLGLGSLLVGYYWICWLGGWSHI